MSWCGCFVVHLSYTSEVIGDEQLIREIQKYQQLWMMEHAYWEKVERDIQDVRASIVGIQTDVQDLKQSIPDITGAVSNLQEDISGTYKHILSC